MDFVHDIVEFIIHWINTFLGVFKFGLEKMKFNLQIDENKTSRKF